MPKMLYEDIISHNSVIFIGAGVSIEGGFYSKPTFYEIIRKRCNFPDELEPPSFPDLMQYFCDNVDGGQRNRLVREAINRIEMFAQKDEINRVTIRIQDSLALVPYFNRIVTTNWDPFIERSLNILVTMVEDRDLAFWDDSKRQLLKIHGCITRPYTLVATREDYETCIRRNPLIFNKLRDLMATKTFIFLGYSLRDSDFELVWNDITNSLGKLRKLAYAIDPIATDETKKYWAKKGIQIINYYGEHFLGALHTRLLKEDLVASDKLLKHLSEQWELLSTARQFTREHQSESIGALASSMYQDGLRHALEDVIHGTSLGKSKDDFEKELVWTQNELERVSKADDLIEIACESGQLEIFRRFCRRKISQIPLYFHPHRLQPIRRFIKG